jgi:hypothetical protein
MRNNIAKRKLISFKMCTSVPYIDIGFVTVPYGNTIKSVWLTDGLALIMGTGGQTHYSDSVNPNIVNWGVAQFGTEFASESGWGGCWINFAKILCCGNSIPTVGLHPFGTSTTFISVSGGSRMTTKYVAIRESDNQLIGFMYYNNVLIVGSVIDINTPEKIIAVTYSGNYICIQSLTNQVYCSSGFTMIPGQIVPWQKLGIALTSIRVGITGTLMGIDANQNLLVSPNCMKPFWMKASPFKFIQVSMIDGNVAWAFTDTNQLLQTKTLNTILVPLPRTLTASSLTLGDGFDSRSPHIYNDQNPIIIEKQYETSGSSYLRILANSLRMYSCTSPPCYDTDSNLKFVFQDGIISALKGICVNRACLSESRIFKLIEMLEYFYTSEDY